MEEFTNLVKGLYIVRRNRQDGGGCGLDLKKENFIKIILTNISCSGNAVFIHCRFLVSLFNKYRVSSIS